MFPEKKLHTSKNAFTRNDGSNGRNRYFAILDSSEFLPIPESDSISTLAKLAPHPNYKKSFPESMIDIKSPALFCGLAASHFGHNLTIPLGRLWAIDQLPSDTKLYFKTRFRPKHSLSIYPILKMFNISNEVILSPFARNEKFEQLYTASDQYGERYNGHASPEFVEWVHGKLDRFLTNKQSNKSIYVSRGRFSDKLGRFACESVVERNLENADYEIYYPEEHSLDHQLDVYSSAQNIIFSEGSAVHVFAFVKRSHQNVAVIQRRKNPGMLLTNQANAFEKTPVSWIDVIESAWHPDIRKDNASVSILDFDKLRDQLVEQDFISKSASWHCPTPSEHAENFALSGKLARID